MRYYFLQLDHEAFQEDDAQPEEWVLVHKNEDVPFQNYKKVRAELNNFELPAARGLKYLV